MRHRTAPRTMVMLFIALTVIVQAGVFGAFASGGDFSLDFIAAEPGTYNHDTGVGGVYGTRQIGDEVVESLEGGDFACGDKVVFFTEITTDAGASGSQDIQLDFSFLMEPTGQPGAGFVDLVSVSVNPNDSSGNQNLEGDEDASIVSETPDTTPPPSQDTLFATVEVSNLDAGDVLILRLVTLLGCQVGSSPTGNLQADLQSAQTVSPSQDAITGGAQTIPFKKVEDIAEPGINVTKSCAPADVEVGDTLTFTITVENTGNETLNNVVVDDSLLGDLSGSFANSLAPGASESHEFTYEVTSADALKVTNNVTASADGAVSGAHVSDSASCSSNVIHTPKITVTKSCTPEAGIGDTITYTISIENEGDESLEGITVDDTLLGDLSGSYADTLAVGASESHEFTHTVTAQDPDPLPNHVDVAAKGTYSGGSTTDEADCQSNVLHVPAIGVTKSCTEFAGVGDTVTYTIEIENKGNEALENVQVSDSLIGDLSGSFADTLAVGAKESHEFTRTVSASDGNAVTNKVTASGSGVDSETPVNADAECTTTIVHPAIQIVKTANPTTITGSGTVTFTYVVTNTGDTPLSNISVDDDILGHIGTVAGPLAPGASVTLTRAVTVNTSSPTRNVGTAVGHDNYGHTVSDTDDAVIAVVLGRKLVRTGSDVGTFLALGLALMLAGLGLKFLVWYMPEEE